AVLPTYAVARRLLLEHLLDHAVVSGLTHPLGLEHDVVTDLSFHFTASLGTLVRKCCFTAFAVLVRVGRTLEILTVWAARTFTGAAATRRLAGVPVCRGRFGLAQAEPRSIGGGESTERHRHLSVSPLK